VIFSICNNVDLRMNHRNVLWLGLFALAGLSGCGESGNTAPGDATPPAVSNLDEGKLQQTLPPRKPAP
jgi:hypothetical protein